MRVRVFIYLKATYKRLEQNRRSCLCPASEPASQPASQPASLNAVAIGGVRDDPFVVVEMRPINDKCIQNSFHLLFSCRIAWPPQSSLCWLENSSIHSVEQFTLHWTTTPPHQQTNNKPDSSSTSPKNVCVTQCLQCVRSGDNDESCLMIKC